MFLRVETIFHITTDEVKIIGEKPYGIELTSRNGFGVAKKSEVGCYIFHSLNEPGWVPNFCAKCVFAGVQREPNNRELRTPAGRFDK